ncbi:hypothetical protein [Saccharibacillus sacchari]|uniref:hypothetical protein n=1 Tax=Saccharibacillus sacchari TaxID=456493 RepID=UPI0004BBE0C7|nr:hypothetical protein [Saccharibacillus sacchari]
MSYTAFYEAAFLRFLDRLSEEAQPEMGLVYVDNDEHCEFFLQVSPVLLQNRLRVILDAMISEFSMEHAEDVAIEAYVDPHRIRIQVTESWIEILVVQENDQMIFAGARYSKESKKLVYHLRLEALRKSLQNLILLDHMNVL